jgi:hypothetical protein
MSIEDRVQLVERLFLKLEKEATQFEESSGLSCVEGCGRCCTYPTIEASPLEFLPWAFHLFLSGEAGKTILELNQGQSTICFNYKPLSLISHGRCMTYRYRGLICRLFGFAATTDKYGNLRLATCKLIKEGQSENYKSVTEAIALGLHVPVFTEYYLQLEQIDFNLGTKILPINKALKMALEEVLQYYAYRPLPDSEKKCG